MQRSAVGGFLSLLGMSLPTKEICITGSAVLLGLIVALEARPPLCVCMALVESLELFRGPVYGQRWSSVRQVALKGDIAWTSLAEQRVAEPSGQRQPQGMSASADRPELDFSLIQGDLLFRVQRAIGFIPRHGLGVTRRALVFASITWLPIAIWAVLLGGALPGITDDSLLQHFGVHVQCLVAIPLLIVGELVAHTIVRRLVPQFLRSGFISTRDQAQFVDILGCTARLRDAWFPWELVMGLGLGWAVGSPASRQAHEILWPGAPEASGPRPGFGGWWFLIVARPLYIALLLAWVWRLALVIVLLWRSARLHLALVPTHPDRAGGLGFLEELPFAFSPFLLALSSVSAARWAHDFLYHGVPVETLTWPLALFLVVVLGLFLTPLAVFGPPLVAAKHRALLE